MLKKSFFPVLVLTCLFLVAFTVDSFAQGIEQLRREYAEAAKRDKSRASKLARQIGDKYKAQGNTNDAIQFYAAAGKFGAESNNNKSAARAYFDAGTLAESNGLTRQAIDNFSKASYNYGLVNSGKQQARAFYRLGSSYSKSGNLKKAISSYTKAADLSESYNLSDLKLSAYSALAGAYSAAGDSENAAKYQRLSQGSRVNVQRNISIQEETLEALNSKLLDSLTLDRAQLDSIKKIKLQLLLEKTNKENELKEADAKLEQAELLQQTQEKELEAQQSRTTALIIGLVAAVVIIIVSIIAFIGMRRANKKLARQNEEIERQKDLVEQEKHKSDELLLNILPELTAEELKEKGHADPKSYDQVSILFTDFKGFTKISEKLTPAEIVSELDYCFKAFDDICIKHNLEKIKTIGDAYMCAGGIPTPNSTNAADAVKAGLEMQEFMRNWQAEKEAKGELAFELRLGIHTGAIVAGVVGKKKFAYDIWGDAVNLAARMESSSEVGKVNVSGATYELIQNDFNCTYRGKIEAKNKGEVDMYFVDGVRFF